MFVKFLRGKDITVELIHCKVNSVLNAIPLNYVLHRIGEGGSSTKSGSQKETDSNANPDESSNSEKKK